MRRERLHLEPDGVTTRRDGRYLGRQITRRGSVVELGIGGAMLQTKDYGEALFDGQLELGSRRTHARFDDEVFAPV